MITKGDLNVQIQSVKRAMRHSAGTPRLLNDEQEKELIQTITNNTPDEIGFIARKNWTIELISQ